MQENSSTFKIPVGAEKEAYNFVPLDNDAKVYQELNAIAEELEKCRLANS